MKSATKVLQTITAAALAVPVLLGASLGAEQTPDVNTILAEARKALGGEKLQQLQSLVMDGKILRSGAPVNGQATTTERAFEIRIQLPDKMLRREVLAAMSNMSIYKNSGFNGADGLINQVDQPPQLSTGTGVQVFSSSRIGPAQGQTQTPEQKEAQRKSQLLATKKEYARLALGLFAAAPSVYPLQFTYAGEAQAPDGTADVLDVKGEGDFAVRLFIDRKTHRPLMLSWMDKELLAGGGAQMQSISGLGGSREEMEKRVRERQAEIAEAEARRRIVEWRFYYGDYKSVSGITIPHRFQMSSDGKAIDELVVERVRVNQKIDDDSFKISK